MMAFERSARTLQWSACQARVLLCLIVASWLAFAQPGTSYFALIDPIIHAQIDAERYGQQPDGETLPGHEPRPPHEHPAVPGITVPGLTLVNPFGSAFYTALLSPAQRLALLDRRVEMAVITQSITLEPPDQPPRLMA